LWDTIRERRFGRSLARSTVSSISPALGADAGGGEAGWADAPPVPVSMRRRAKPAVGRAKLERRRMKSADIVLPSDKNREG
jgi:hypothetical protein